MSDRSQRNFREYHNKLIRDNIPQIIAETGSKYEMIVLSESEFLKVLKDKLVEEAKEVQQATEKELITELADVYEVIDTLINKHQLSMEDIKKEQERKRKIKGGFEQKLYLLWTEKNYQ
jgi:predicted house-cleaning noncanonical NTP pyrophosphatase (MazG superfamily)